MTCLVIGKVGVVFASPQSGELAEYTRHAVPVILYPGRYIKSTEKSRQQQRVKLGLKELHGHRVVGPALSVRQAQELAIHVCQVSVCDVPSSFCKETLKEKRALNLEIAMENEQLLHEDCGHPAVCGERGDRHEEKRSLALSAVACPMPYISV